MTDRARAHVFIATSLDGLIARPDGRIDWLLAANAAVPPGEDCGYAAFSGRMDALVMGRHTFEQVLTFPEWPYGDKPVIVLSRRGVAVPAALADRVRTSAEAPRALLQQLGREGRRHVYVDGGQVVQAFLRDGLVDEMTITTIPVLLGAGRPLFGAGPSALPGDVALQLRDVRHWPFGFVQCRWAVADAAAGAGQAA